MQASAELLKNAGERLQQDRLIEPANDSAKYYLLALRASTGECRAARRDAGSGNSPDGQGAPCAGTRAIRCGAKLARGSGRGGLLFGRLRFVAPRPRRGVGERQFLSNVVASAASNSSSRPSPYTPQSRAESGDGLVELNFTVAEDVGEESRCMRRATRVFDAAQSGSCRSGATKPVQRDAKPWHRGPAYGFVSLWRIEFPPGGQAAELR